MKRLLVLAFLVISPIVTRGNQNLSKYSGTYKGETESFRDRTMTLSLGDDGTATLTQSPDAVREITSFGRWAHQGDMIMLTLDPVGKQSTPAPMTFRLNHKTLTPVLWNHSLWTAPPPAMKRMKIKKHDPDDDL